MPPAVIAAAVGATAAVGTALINSKASSKAGKLQQETAREGAASVERQFQQTRSDLSPWREKGAQAANKYGGFLGLNGPQGGGVQPSMYGEPKRTSTGALEGEVLPPEGAAPMNFKQALELNPQYGFLRSEGMRGIEGSAAAKGTLQSGRTLKSLSRFNQNLAYGMSESYLNRLSNVSSQGVGAAAQTGAFGAQATGQQTRLLQQGAASRASGYLGSANAWGQAIQSVGNTAGGYLGYSSGGVPTGNTPDVREQLRTWG